MPIGLLLPQSCVRQLVTKLKWCMRPRRLMSVNLIGGLLLLRLQSSKCVKLEISRQCGNLVLARLVKQLWVRVRVWLRLCLWDPRLINSMFPYNRLTQLLPLLSPCICCLKALMCCCEILKILKKLL